MVCVYLCACIRLNLTINRVCDGCGCQYEYTFMYACVFLLFVHVFIFYVCLSKCSKEGRKDTSFI